MVLSETNEGAGVLKPYILSLTSLLFLHGCTIGDTGQWQQPDKSIQATAKDLDDCKEYVKRFAPKTTKDAEDVYKEHEMRRCMERKGYSWEGRR